MNLNFPANLGEIVEFPAREVEELAVLVVVGLALGLDELENEGAACADVVAAWEEVSADEGFEDAGLAAALAADHRNLREVDGGVAPHTAEDVLEPVHQRDHRRAERSGAARHRHRS